MTEIICSALLSGGRYTVDNEVDPTHNSKMVTELEIDNVSHLDWGVYTCKAENRIGNHEAAVVLKGERLPHYKNIFNDNFPEKQEKKYSKRLRNSKKTTHSGFVGTTAKRDSMVTKIPGRNVNYRRRQQKEDNEQTEEFSGNEYIASNQESEDANDEYNHYSYFNSSSPIVIYSFFWLCLVQILLRI